MEVAVEVQAPRMVPIQDDLDPAGLDRFVQSVPVFRDAQVDAVVGRAVVMEVLDVVDWHFVCSEQILCFLVMRLKRWTKMSCRSEKRLR